MSTSVGRHTQLEAHNVKKKLPQETSDRAMKKQMANGFCF